MSPKSKSEVHLPGYVPEDDWPTGDGPRWIAEAIGAKTGTPIAATSYLSDDGEEMAIVLRVGDREILFRPARLIVTRRLAEVLGGLGFPVPYYAPPQVALLGQAIGRLANRSRTEQEARTADAFSSVVGAWLADCLTENTAYLLAGRAGPDVRAAIKHVRAGRRLGTAPLIVEPERNVLLAWTVPVAAHVRDRLGSAHDATISTQLQRERLTRERLDARPGPDDRGTVGMPLWVVPNGWQGVEVEMPDGDWECGPWTAVVSGGVRDPIHARAGTHAGGK